MSDCVGVTYLAVTVELGDADDLNETPHHPKAQALLSVVLELNDTNASRRERFLISGDMRDPSDGPTSCRLHPCCPGQLIGARKKSGNWSPPPLDAKFHVGPWERTYENNWMTDGRKVCARGTVK